MNKLDELKEYVTKLFENATEKSVIENAAVVSNKIDEIAQEQKRAQEDYNSLLKDYKEVVIHSSFKPANSADKGADIPNASSVNLDSIIADALKKAMEEKNK